MKYLRTCFVAIIVTQILSACRFGENCIHLIPDGYIGPVIIIFDQPDGQTKRYENGWRVYEIPDNGILKTQFGPTYGIQQHLYYYVDGSAKRKPLTYLDKWTELDSFKGIYVFEQTTGSKNQIINTETMSRTGSAAHFVEYFVGEPNELDSLIQLVKFPEDIKFPDDH